MTLYITHHLRQGDKPLSGLEGTRPLRLFPEWSIARGDQFSNTASIVKAAELENFDSSLSSRALNLNQNPLTADMQVLGDVYVYAIPGDFLFQYTESAGTILYKTPKVIGTSGSLEIELTEAAEDSRSMMFPKPGSYIGSELLVEEAETLLVGDGADLDGEIFFLEKESPIFIRVSQGDLSEELPGGDIFTTSYVSIVNIETKELHKISLPFMGEFSTGISLQRGLYQLHTSILDASIELSISFYGFHRETLPEQVWKLSGVDRDFSFSYKLGEDPSYLDLVSFTVNPFTPGGDTYVTVGASVMLGEDEEPHEGLAIAKGVALPYLFVLSNEETNLIHVYSTFKTEPQTLYRNNKLFSMDLAIVEEGNKIGDELQIRTDRRTAGMNQDFSKFRLRVDELDSGSSYFLTTAGDLTDENGAWLMMSKDNNFWEQRWKFIIDNLGAHRFTLEGTPVGSTEVETLCEKIWMLEYKDPIGVLDLSEEEFILVDITVDPEGRLLGLDDEGNIREIRYTTNDFAIDFNNYLLYTNFPWESVEVIYV